MALQLATSQIEPDIAVVRISGNLTFEPTDALLSLLRFSWNKGKRNWSWI